MKLKQFVDLAFRMWKDAVENGRRPQTLCVLGPPGVGKTSAARAVADRMTEYMQSKNEGSPAAISRVLDLSSMLPEDLNGLPWRNGKQTEYAPQTWMAELCRSGAYGVLCLDDLPAAAPAVQVASRQVSLEGRVHDSHLSPMVMVIVTGNRREDKSAASTLPAHFRNSVGIFEIEITVDDWFEWAANEADIDPVVPAFMLYRPSHLSKLPKDADAKGSFATPRTWTMVGRNWKAASAIGMGFDLVSGLVGDGVAVEFNAFVNVRSALVNPKEVLADPKRALPNPGKQLDTPDKAVSMSTGLGEVAASMYKHAAPTDRTTKKEVPLKFLKAIAWATQEKREYIAMAVTTYVSYGGPIDSIVSAARQNAQDPDIRDCLIFLQKTFK